MKQRNKLNSYGFLLGALLVAACNNPEKPAPVSHDSLANTVALTAVISYDIVSENPHDPTAFTEGLEFRNGYLYESTGQYGSSDVRKPDVKTGKVPVSK